ncbi:MAG: hypothetical protein AAF331_11200, partial [Pseudomonadota bacterium]
ELADKSKDDDVRFRVRTHWLFEEYKSGQIDSAFVDSAIQQLDRFSKKASLPKSTLAIWKNMKSRIDDSGLLLTTYFDREDDQSKSVEVLRRIEG